MAPQDDKAKPEILKAEAGELQPEPPVVARMIVEIRSDGSRTIARGAIEDTNTGQRTTIEATGASPIQLAFALARSLTQLPGLSTRAVIRGLLGGRKR